MNKKHLTLLVLFAFTAGAYSLNGQDKEATLKNPAADTLALDTLKNIRLQAVEVVSFKTVNGIGRLNDAQREYITRGRKRRSFWWIVWTLIKR